jgi:membrane protein YqaA with SNARE-associated domain
VSFALLGAIQQILSNPFFAEYGFVGLFLNGLFAALVPLPTELTVSALILAGQPKETVFVVLTTASVLGGFVAYYIGYGGNRFLLKFKSAKRNNYDHHRQHEKGHAILLRYGWLAIFLSSWIPIVGDIIPMAAGAKRYEMKKFAIAMVTGKVVKVMATVYLTGIILPYIFDISHIGSN